MTAQIIPNWLRVCVSLCVALFQADTQQHSACLSFLSFLPQLQHIWLRKDCSGISLYYVLFNLISATEQFTLTFFIQVNDTEGADFFVGRPSNAGDWLNLCQVTVVWVLFLAL